MRISTGVGGGLFAAWSGLQQGYLAVQGQGAQDRIVDQNHWHLSHVTRSAAIAATISLGRNVWAIFGGWPFAGFIKKARSARVLGPHIAVKQRLLQLRRRCCSPSNRPDELPADLTPLDLVPMGNYAVSVGWSDGHQSLLPYRSFVEGYGE